MLFIDDLWYELGGAAFAYEHHKFRKQVFLVEQFKEVEKKKEISQIVKEDRGLEKDVDQVKKSKKVVHVKTIKRENSRKTMKSSMKPNQIKKPVTTFRYIE